MTTVTIRGYIHASPRERWNEAHAHGMRFTFFEHDDLTRSGYVMVCPYTMTFELPDGWDARPQQVAMLEAKKADLQAQYAAALALINQQISELLCIEHQPAEVTT